MQVWRLGRSTYVRDTVRFAAECFVCGYMTFDHGDQGSCVAVIGDHVMKSHPVAVVLSMADVDGWITTPDSDGAVQVIVGEDRSVRCVYRRGPVRG